MSSLCEVVRDVRSIRAAKGKSERLRTLLTGIFSDNSILSRVSTPDFIFIQYITFSYQYTFFYDNSDDFIHDMLNHVTDATRAIVMTTSALVLITSMLILFFAGSSVFRSAVVSLS